MGLFDGNAAAALEGSSAEIAALLELPVILVVNARGMAGSIAPLVRGFAGWHPAVRIAGVIANNVGSARHTELLRGSLAAAGLPPLLGGVPRDERLTLPGAPPRPRHRYARSVMARPARRYGRGSRRP